MDVKCVRLNNPAAWQWELLRRSDTYGAFYVKADAIRVFDQADRSLAGFIESAKSLASLRTLAGSISRLGGSDPCQRWLELVFARCVPELWWTALSEQSRKVAAKACPLYPRADNAATFSTPFGLYLEAEPVVIERLASGQEELVSAGDSASTAIMGKQDGSNILPDGVARGAYVVLIFDSRFTEQVLAKLATEKFKPVLERQLSQLLKQIACAQNLPAFSARGSLVRVLPSKVPDWCQVWVPADALTNADEILRTFRTFIGSRKKRDWQPKCEQAWRTLFPTHSASSIAPVKAKPARVKSQKDLQLGLCAYDCRRIEPRFTRQGLLIPLLKRFQGFRNVDDPELLRDSLKQVSRLLDSIDSFYSTVTPTR